MRLLILLMLTNTGACSSFRPTTTPRVFHERTFRFCSVDDLPKFAGKLCYRRCIKRRILGKCKKWQLDSYDLSDPSIHIKFLSAGMKVKV